MTKWVVALFVFRRVWSGFLAIEIRVVRGGFGGSDVGNEVVAEG